jgi:hypothetical protein
MNGFLFQNALVGIALMLGAFSQDSHAFGACGKAHNITTGSANLQMVRQCFTKARPSKPSEPQDLPSGENNEAGCERFGGNWRYPNLMEDASFLCWEAHKDAASAGECIDHTDYSCSPGEFVFKLNTNTVPGCEFAYLGDRLYASVSGNAVCERAKKVIIKETSVKGAVRASSASPALD